MTMTNCQIDYAKVLQQGSTPGNDDFDRFGICTTHVQFLPELNLRGRVFDKPKMRPLKTRIPMGAAAFTLRYHSRMNRYHNSVLNVRMCMCV